MAVPVAIVATLPTDRQNVHDHAIAQTIKKNVKHIVVDCGDYDRIELIDNVMSALGTTKLTEKVLAGAFRVLVSLVPDKVESVGCSQIDVLKATKSKIDGVDDKHVKKNLIETLGKNLASGIERGHVVCSTGKIASSPPLRAQTSRKTKLCQLKVIDAKSERSRPRYGTMCQARCLIKNSLRVSHLL